MIRTGSGLVRPLCPPVMATEKSNSLVLGPGSELFESLAGSLFSVNDFLTDSIPVGSSRKVSALKRSDLFECDSSPLCWSIIKLKVSEKGSTTLKNRVPVGERGKFRKISRFNAPLMMHEPIISQTKQQFAFITLLEIPHQLNLRSHSEKVSRSAISHRRKRSNSFLLPQAGNSSRLVFTSRLEHCPPSTKLVITKKTLKALAHKSPLLCVSSFSF